VTSFASVADLAALTQQSIAEDDPTATLLLELATGVIRDYCGWQIDEVVDDELVLAGLEQGSSTLFLPTLRLTAVASVQVAGDTVDPTAYTWSSAGWLELVRHQTWDRTDPTLFRQSVPGPIDDLSWPTANRSVTVTATHGHPTVPASIRSLCIDLARRVYVNPRNLIASSTTETIGTTSESDSQRYESNRLVVVFTDEDAAVLDAYRLPNLP
jgi:hypothetical protein